MPINLVAATAEAADMVVVAAEATEVEDTAVVVEVMEEAVDMVVAAASTPTEPRATGLLARIFV